MRFLMALIAGMLLVGRASADVVFSFPQSPTGGLIPSSWVPPDGTDADQYAWESFTLTAPATITEIQWQGDGFGNGAGFTIVVNPSVTLPDPITALGKYTVPGNAGQTPAGIVNGTQRFTYNYLLPTPLSLAAGTYWINIEGTSGWSASYGTGGNGSHIEFFVGLAMFLNGPGDVAFTLIGSSPPQITQQPASQTICAGSNASFTVASGSAGPLTYQWRRNDVNLADDGHFSGALSSTFQITGIGASDAAAYTCVVTSAAGSTTSNAANLTVANPPVVTVQPAPQGGCVGATIILSANVTSALPLSAQWRRNGVPIPGATQTTFYAFFANANGPGSYDCVYTNSCGSATTNAVDVTVYSTSITQQPSPTAACLGSSASFTVAGASNAPMTYTWRFNSVPISTVSNPTAGTPTLVINPVGTADLGSYDCTISGSCNSATSAPALLSDGTPALVSSPSSVTACRGNDVSFSVVVSGMEPLTYVWSKDSVAMDSVANPSAATPTLSLHNVQYPNAAIYGCTVSNACGLTRSLAAVLTICPADLTCDGGVDINDLLAFLSAFELGDAAADLDNGSFTGTPDGGVDVNDLLFFLVHFEGGC